MYLVIESLIYTDNIDICGFCLISFFKYLFNQNTFPHDLEFTSKPPFRMILELT